MSPSEEWLAGLAYFQVGFQDFSAHWVHVVSDWLPPRNEALSVMFGHAGRNTNKDLKLMPGQTPKATSVCFSAVS